MSPEELRKKADKEYPELQPEQREALVQFVIYELKVTPIPKETQKCATEPDSSTAK